jgi:hypothetical protein
MFGLFVGKPRRNARKPWFCAECGLAIAEAIAEAGK